MVKYDLTKPSAAFGEPHFPAECRCCFDNGSLYDGVEAIREAGGDSAHENKLHLSLTRMLFTTDNTETASLLSFETHRTMLHSLFPLLVTSCSYFFPQSITKDEGCITLHSSGAAGQ